MRLKEPLMGLSIMQGHLVVHLSIFVGSMCIDQERWKNTVDISSLKKEVLTLQNKTQESLIIMRWLHFLSASMILTTIFLKVNRLHDYAAIISVIQPMIYIFPIIYLVQKTQNIALVEELKMVETNEWMEVEN